MDSDLADHLDAAPELRLAAHTYRELFGRPPLGVWHAPGTITLLAGGPLRLTVAARWGAIVAAGPRDDGLIEAVRTNRPDKKVRLTVAEAAAGTGPSWAGPALRQARAGATLLVNTDLPDGAGLGAAGATETAISMALAGLIAAEPPVADGAVMPGTVRHTGPAAGGHRAGHAAVGGYSLPFDLNAAGLRLMIIDTRARAAPLPPLREHSPVLEAAAALQVGRPAALGPMLTAAHAELTAALAAAPPATLGASPPAMLDPAAPAAASPAGAAAGEVQQIAVTAALCAGALGARMLIEGPGRPACALLPAALLTDVRRAIAAAFSARGLPAPRLLTVSPADGPRRAA